MDLNANIDDSIKSLITKKMSLDPNSSKRLAKIIKRSWNYLLKKII